MSLPDSVERSAALKHIHCAAPRPFRSASCSLAVFAAALFYIFTCFTPLPAFARTTSEVTAAASPALPAASKITSPAVEDKTKNASKKKARPAKEPKRVYLCGLLLTPKKSGFTPFEAAYHFYFKSGFKYKKTYGFSGPLSVQAAAFEALRAVTAPVPGELLLHYGGTVETALIEPDGYFAFAVPENFSGGEMCFKFRDVSGRAGESAEIKLEKGKNYVFRIYPAEGGNIKVMTAPVTAGPAASSPASLKKAALGQMAKISRLAKKPGGLAGRVRLPDPLFPAKSVRLLLLPDKKETAVDRNGYFRFGPPSDAGVRFIVARAGEKFEKTLEIIIDGRDAGFVSDAISVKFNSPPRISGVRVAGGSGDIAVDYDVSDEDGDECAVSSFRFSTDNAVSFATSENAVDGGKREGFFGFAREGRRRLIWRSRADIRNNPNNVILKLSVTDGKEESAPALSPSFSIRNNSRPSISGVVVSGSSDEITISYDLSDADGDTISTSVYYSLDNGMTFNRTDAVSGDINFVTPTPGKRIIWRSRSDIRTDSHNVKIRLTAFDGVEESHYQHPASLAIFNNFSRPSISVESVCGDSNEIEVIYSLLDSDENSCLVELSYSVDSVKFFRSAAVSGEVSGVKPGRGRRLKWSSRNDLKLDTDSLYIELTAFDGTGYGEKSVFGPAPLRNNRPPNVENIYPADVSGEIVIFYDLIDEEFDTCSIDFYYSIDNGATFRGNANITGEISSVRPGARRSIKWKTRPELNGDYDGVKVKISARQRPEKEGRPAVSPPFSIRNNRSPGVSNVYCEGVSGEVEVSFDLNDADNHSCTVEVYYSLDDGANYKKASIGTSGDAVIKPGRGRRVKWLSERDFRTSEDRVRLKIIPFDAYARGYEGVSGAFAVANNEAPFVSNISVSGDSGEIAISYDLYDPEDNTCEVKLWYLTDGSPEFVKSVHVYGDRAAVSTGTGRRIIWDSRSDFTSDNSKLKIKLVAEDGNLKGKECVYGPFSVKNNRLPVISDISAASNSGDISFYYLLSDADGDDCTVDLYYSPGGGAPFKKSASVSGEIKGVRPGGGARWLCWSSGEDLAGEFSGALVKLVAIDKSGAGPGTVYGPFVIDNKNISAVTGVSVESMSDGTFQINYSLGAFDENLCTVEVYYSLDGVKFPAENRLTGLSGDTAEVPAGRDKKIIWDPSADLMIDSTVYLKLSPIDKKARGAAGYSKPFRLRNAPVEVKLMPEVWPREGHAHLSMGGKMFIIGGWAGSPNYYNDVTMIDYDPSSGSFAVEISQNHYSSVRYSHSSAVYDGRLWLMGGFFNKSKNDVWYSSDGTTWVEITKNETDSVKFSMRDSHASVVFDDGFGEKLFVIGGFSSGYRNDVWCSATGAQWTCITAETAFSPRVGHGAAVFGGRIYLTGGFDGERYLNDIWRSPDGIRWEMVSPSAGFSPRRGHAFAVYRDRLWVIGGYGENEKYYNDIWCSSDGVSWRKIVTDAPGSPMFTPRRGHSAVPYKGGLWVFGGYDGTSYRGDFWMIR